MNVSGEFTDSFTTTLDASTSLVEDLECVVGMTQLAKSYDTSFYVCWERISSSEIHSIPFWHWVASKNDPTLRDLKRSLQIFLRQALPSEENQGDSSHNFTISKGSPDAVWSQEDYFRFKQTILITIQSKAEFSDSLEECFPMVFFDQTVKPSLGTLNGDFLQMRQEIVEHLGALDRFRANHESICFGSIDNRGFCQEFLSFSGIDTSPQNNRDDTSRLKREYTNITTKKTEKLCCELHTKFNKYGIDTTKQDRIYFHRGKKGICDDKLIVVHIGTHL